VGVESFGVLIFLDESEVPIIVETGKELIADIAGLGSRRFDKAPECFPKHGSFSFLRAQVGNDS
jgi:hypothetical protein